MPLAKAKRKEEMEGRDGGKMKTGTARVLVNAALLGGMGMLGRVAERTSEQAEPLTIR